MAQSQMKTFKTQINDWPETGRNTAWTYLPEGERVRVEVYINYLHYYPASRLGSELVVNQTWAVEESFNSYDPFRDHGNFNLDTLKWGLLPDGDGVWLEFDVPDAETSFRFQTQSWIYYCGSNRKKERGGQYTLMVFPTMSHDEKYEDIPLAEAPGF